MRYDQRPPQVDAMRFMPDDANADAAAINTWLAALQVGDDPVYAATFRASTPADDEFFPDWDPKPQWFIAQAESSMGTDPQLRPVRPGDWIVIPAVAYAPQAWVTDDTSFHLSYVLA